MLIAFRIEAIQEWAAIPRYALLGKMGYRDTFYVTGNPTECLGKSESPTECLSYSLRIWSIMRDVSNFILTPILSLDGDTQLIFFGGERREF